MLIPVRVKIKLSHFPFATLAIMAAMVATWPFVSDGYLTLRPDAAAQYGFLGDSTLLGLVTSPFLHNDVATLIMGVILLLVFGTVVEDRLRIPLFLALFVVSANLGGLVQDAIAPDSLPGGTAACGVAGILGASLYMFFWARIEYVFLARRMRNRGLLFDDSDSDDSDRSYEIPAAVGIGAVLLLDLFYALRTTWVPAWSGDQYVGHLAGVAAGALLCFLIRAPRDPRYVADAKAYESDVVDPEKVPLTGLLDLAEADPCNPEIMRAMLHRAADEDREAEVIPAVTRAGPQLADKDPDLVIQYLTEMKGDASIYPPQTLLHLGISLESRDDVDRALTIFRILADKYPSSADAEVALYHMANLYWEKRHNPESARSCLEEMASHFPNGEMADYGDELKQQMGQSV